MAKSVAVGLISHTLSREENGVVFSVDDDGTKFGELVVSKGGIRWRPKNKQDHHFLSWAQLDTLMRQQPKR